MVALGHCAVVLYHWLWIHKRFAIAPQWIHPKDKRSEQPHPSFWSALRAHLGRTEGFLMLSTYLTVYWWSGLRELLPGE